jgi:hypothetical protein
LLWATIFGFLVSRAFGLESRRVWLTAALVGLSHFLLDGLVHIAGLPLAGENSPKLGLGLWQNMPLELALETVMTFAGIALYWRLSQSSALSRYGMAVFMVVFLAMMWTQLASTVPPQPHVLTVSWLVAPVVLGAIAYALDWQRVHRGVPVGGRSQTRNLHPTPEI